MSSRSITVARLATENATACGRAGRVVLKITVYYDEGGPNYFSGGYNKRGYRLSLKRITIDDQGYESFLIGGGEGDGIQGMIAEATRYNAKHLQKHADEALSSPLCKQLMDYMIGHGLVLSQVVEAVA